MTKDYRMDIIVNFADGTDERHEQICNRQELHQEIDEYLNEYKGTSFTFIIVPHENVI